MSTDYPSSVKIQLISPTPRDPRGRLQTLKQSTMALKRANDRLESRIMKGPHGSKQQSQQAK